MRGTASQMRDLGIEQAGSPVLAVPCRPWVLPDESAQAGIIVAQLDQVLRKITYLHDFTKGRGIAAPQIGHSAAVAVIITAEGQRTVLMNPVITESNGYDDQYEGCLSFFNSRVLVIRPRVITVEHQSATGEIRLTEFRDAEARLACHEIDHLNGMLCISRMKPGSAVVPAASFIDDSKPWMY